MDKKLIPDEMAKIIINSFEVVEVNKHQGMHSVVGAPLKDDVV